MALHGAIQTTLGDATLWLTPRRAVWRPETSTLFVADLHVGKDAAFRAMGVPAPAGASLATLERLSDVLTACDAERLVILGDLLHARASARGASMDALRAWRAAWPDLHVTLVEGNHDRRAGALDDALDIRVVDEGQTLDGLVLAHEPPAGSDGSPRLAGHLHPVFRLRARGLGSVRTPCYWRRGETIVLPAFGAFTGGSMAQRGDGDQIFMVTDDAVLRAPAPGATVT